MSNENGVQGMQSLQEKRGRLNFTNGWESEKMVVIFYLKDGKTEPHFLTRINTVQEIISDKGGNIWLDAEDEKKGHIAKVIHGVSSVSSEITDSRNNKTVNNQKRAKK